MLFLAVLSHPLPADDTRHTPLEDLALDEVWVTVVVEDQNDNPPMFMPHGRPIVAAVPATASYGQFVTRILVSFELCDGLVSPLSVLPRYIIHFLGDFMASFDSLTWVLMHFERIMAVSVLFIDFFFQSSWWEIFILFLALKPSSIFLSFSSASFIAIFPIIMI